jgi:dihydrofolate synthase/folylpolyglutamate synthase
LLDYVERIQIDGEPIPHEMLVELVEVIKPFVAQVEKLTTFEITTALAFLYFARRGASAVIAEVGLGGRLDATNIVLPVTAVITSLSFDHMQVLGNTVAEIAAEKAGIIKPGIPVVLAPQVEEARQVVERVAQERGSPLIQIGRDYQYSLLEHNLDRQSLLVWKTEPGMASDDPERRTLEANSAVKLTIPLLGEHQVENAAVAYAALQTAASRGLRLDQEALQRGFAQVSWPGRFEILQREPPVIVDSAHNRDSARKLAKTLETYFPDREVILVFGASEDKDISGMLAELTPRVRQVIFTQSFHPRAIRPEELTQLALPFGKPTQIVPAVEDALQVALAQADEKSLVLAAGSIFVAAGIRQTWYNQIKER